MTFYQHSVTVFCGSRFGNDPDYILAARALASGFVQRNIRLIFGGGNVGIMGEISNHILDLGGAIKGVIPKFLQKTEGKHSRIKDLIITEDMHSRKKLLYQDTNAFICLPGGIGTFDEVFEILTWKQLHLHDHPIIILNINHWADNFLKMLKTIVEQGFANSNLLQLYIELPTVAETLLFLDKQFKQNP